MSEAQKTTEQKLYEVSFHIVPSVAAEKVSDEVSVIKKSLTTHKASIVSEVEPMLINLAYTMSKKILDANYNFDKAYFGSIIFNATAADAEKIKADIEKNNSILRFLLIKTVNDPEHSTNKIPREKKDELVEAEPDVAEDGVDVGAEAVLDESEKQVDAAIDELVK